MKKFEELKIVRVDLLKENVRHTTSAWPASKLELQSTSHYSSGYRDPFLYVDSFGNHVRKILLANLAADFSLTNGHILERPFHVFLNPADWVDMVVCEGARQHMGLVDIDMRPAADQRAFGGSPVRSDAYFLLDIGGTNYVTCWPTAEVPFHVVGCLAGFVEKPGPTTCEGRCRCGMCPV